MDDPILKYIDSLEDQCEKWEQMYNEIKAERDQLKEQLDANSAEITTTSRQQVRHV